MSLNRIMAIGGIAANVSFAIPSMSHAKSLTLADITSVDDLGYECVDGAYFEETLTSAAVAFTLSEKIRLPRTCLPDPCDAALSRRELSQITGTEVILARFEREWDEYYARYADYCRKETVDQFAADNLDDPSFWSPITANTISPLPGSSAVPGPSPTILPPEITTTLVASIPSPTPVSPFPDPTPPVLVLSDPNIDPDLPTTSGSPDDDDDPVTMPDSDDPTTDILPDIDDDPELTPVPLPSSLGLMLISLAALGFGRRLRRS